MEGNGGNGLTTSGPRLAYMRNRWKYWDNWRPCSETSLRSRDSTAMMRWSLNVRPWGLTSVSPDGKGYVSLRPGQWQDEGEGERGRDEEVGREGRGRGEWRRGERGGGEGRGEEIKGGGGGGEGGGRRGGMMVRRFQRCQVSHDAKYVMILRLKAYYSGIPPGVDSLSHADMLQVRRSHEGWDTQREECEKREYWRPLPRVSRMFLYRLIESVSFINSRTTSPCSFSTTSTSSGFAIREIITRRSCEGERLAYSSDNRTGQCGIGSWSCTWLSTGL